MSKSTSALLRAGMTAGPAYAGAPPAPVRRLVQAVCRVIERNAHRRALQAMPDHLLKDIGVSRCDIDRVVDTFLETLPLRARH